MVCCGKGRAPSQLPEAGRPCQSSDRIFVSVGPSGWAGLILGVLADRRNHCLPAQPAGAATGVTARSRGSRRSERRREQRGNRHGAVFWV